MMLSDRMQGCVFTKITLRLKNEYAKMALLNLLHYNYRLKAVLGTNWIQKYEDYLSHTY